MTKAEFAEQVCKSIWQEQGIQHGTLAVMNSLGDDYFFDIYLKMRCKDCGKKFAEDLDVEQILAESVSEMDFFHRCVTAMKYCTLLLGMTGRERLTKNGSELTDQERQEIKGKLIELGFWGTQSKVRIPVIVNTKSG